MLISVRWLNEFLGSKLTVDKIVDLMMRSGLEVEETTDLGMGSGKIVVAEVLEVDKVPDTDHLHLARVALGEETPVTIICGASNLYPGMRVACARPGAVLPGELRIKKQKIRGHTSEGMLCSARELNFGTDHTGIMELPADEYEIGEPFDFIIDVKITPNRADCLSIVGVARDLAAMVGKKVYPATPRFRETLTATDQAIDLEIRAREACPRYTVRYITEVVVGPSPLWLQRRLESCGMRSINNIVDITNFAMLELGVPLHAFDYDRLREAKIIVRMAEEGEKLVTLDEREIELTSADLVIADAERPIALAGVMGGKETEVDEGTTQIALECAYFEPTGIRRTARRHGFQTESTYRFERGVDRMALGQSIGRATQLIQDLAEGEVSKGMLDVHQSMAEAPPITLRLARVNDLLGLELTNSDVADRLVNLGFEIRESDRDVLVVASPSHRVDIEADVDLIEEVARIHGYENIPETMPAIRSRRLAEGEGTEIGYANDVREILVGLGLTEAVHYSTMREEAAERHGYDPAAQPHIANPLTIEQTIMRPTLLADLLRTAAYNQRQGAESVAMFEIDKTFIPGARVGHEEDEPLSLALVLAGSRPGNWARRARPFDFYDLRGLLEALFGALHPGSMSIDKLGEGPNYHPGRSAAVRVAKREVARFGELHPDQAAHYEVRGRLYLAEVDLPELWKLLAENRRRFEPIARFPSSERDLALVVDEGLEAGELIEVALKAGRPVVENLSMVDLYAGEGVPEGKKSLALRFRLRSAEGTLTEEEINGVMKKILRKVQKQCGAALRS